MNDLNLVDPIQKALKTQGYKEPTLIQQQAIPKLLQGKDLLGTAQTGTGKTAAFAIPILQMLSQEKPLKGKSRVIRSLVIAPTRELALQISESFNKYGANLNLKTLTIYGGVSQRPQVKQLNRGVDILVATPGRLLDLINQEHIHLNHVQHFVLDEADLMLDMGMLQDVRKILKFVPKNRQTMLFSATMPKAIEKLTKTMLNNPVKVEVTPVSSTVDTIEQQVYFVNHQNKTNLLIDLLKDDKIETALIFSRTKHGANRITSSLNKAGFAAQAIHGNKSQKARQRALNNFKQRKTKILVATDIAARGIDIAQLSHVINYNLPEVAETYVHRIGRTGRSGNAGVAISFCDPQEKYLFGRIEKLTGNKIPENKDHAYPLTKKGNKKNSNKRNKRNNKRSNRKTKNGKSFEKANKKQKNNHRRGKNYNQQRRKKNNHGRKRKAVANVS